MGFVYGKGNRYVALVVVISIYLFVNPLWVFS